MSEKEAHKSDKTPIKVRIKGKEKLMDPDHPDLVSGSKIAMSVDTSSPRSRSSLRTNRLSSV